MGSEESESETGAVDLPRHYDEENDSETAC
jgi:hypothetical protein